MIDITGISVNKLRKMFYDIKEDEYLDYIEAFMNDGRREVNKFGERLIKKNEKYQMEIKRIENIKAFESSLHDDGYKYIAGIDEVGRGPLAGPVVTAAVILPKESNILYINDSKKLSSQKREELAEKIKEEAISYAIGIKDNNIIDKINILNATKEAMLEAVDKLSVKPEVLLIDAVHLNTDIKQEAFVKGDENIYSIAAASIVAKVYRDKLMEEYAKAYPCYGFEKNKGYGTFDHIEAIKNNGLCPIHRSSFTNNLVTNTVQKGKNYEKVVCNYLEKHGYDLLYRNYKCKYGEIDIIIKKKNIIAFVEVKGRHKNLIEPRKYVNEDKQKKIVLSAMNYLKEKDIENCSYRFDVVEIIDKTRGSFEINVIENAFNADVIK